MIDVDALRKDVFERCRVCGIAKSKHPTWNGLGRWTHDFTPETDVDYFLRRRKELLGTKVE